MLRSAPLHEALEGSSVTPYLRRRVTVLTAVAAAATLALTSLSVQPASAEPTQHIPNGDFTAGTTGWWSTDNAPISATDGQLCADIPGGTANAWDVSLGHNDIPLANGAAYQ